MKLGCFMIQVKSMYNIKTQSIRTWRQALKEKFLKLSRKRTGNIGLRSHYKNVLYSDEKVCCRQLLFYPLYVSCWYVCMCICVCVYSWYTHTYAIVIQGIYICVYVYIYRQTERQREMSERQEAGEIEKDLHLDIVKQLSNSCKHQTKIMAVQIFVFCYFCQLSHISMKIDIYIYVWQNR